MQLKQSVFYTIDGGSWVTCAHNISTLYNRLFQHWLMWWSGRCSSSDPASWIGDLAAPPRSCCRACGAKQHGWMEPDSPTWSENIGGTWSGRSTVARFLATARSGRWPRLDRFYYGSEREDGIRGVLTRVQGLGRTSSNGNRSIIKRSDG
jgi:hypothetical protein